MSNIEKAREEIKSLVSRQVAVNRSFQSGMTSVTDSDVLEATEGLSLEDFALLYKTLNEISSQYGSDFCETRDWAIKEGQSRPTHESPQMSVALSDYYDNEVSAAHIANREEQSAICHVRGLLEDIEKKLKSR